MTLNKNTQMILGVGAVAIVGYLLWKRQSDSTAVAAPASTSFAGPVGHRGKFNATGTSKIASSAMLGCPCQKTPTEYDTTSTGITLWHCPGGQWCQNVADGISTTNVPKAGSKSRMGSF